MAWRLEGLLAAADTADCPVDPARRRPGVNAYVVPSLDRPALQFSLQVWFERDRFSVGLQSKVLDGVAAVPIEAVKATSLHPSATPLDPLAGRGSSIPHRHTAPVEP